MNIRNMITDSIIYSFKGKIDFLFLGALLWFLRFGFYHMEYWEDPVLSIIVFVPWAIFSMVQLGYLAKIMENTIHGSNVIPKFKNFKNLIFLGIKEFIIGFLYLLVPITILIILLFNIVLFSLDFSALLLIVLFIITLFFSVVMLEGAIIHYQCNHSELKAAFQFRKILRKIVNMRVSKFFSALVLVLMITLFLEPFIAEFSTQLHPLLSLIMEFVVLPFLAIFSCRFMGVIGRHHFNEE